MATSKAEEQDFVDAQKIWLDYITDIDSFKLLPADSITLRTAGEAYNSLAGYARTIFYLLTGERITRTFMHLDSTVTQRNNTTIVNDKDPEKEEISWHVFPNPSAGNIIEVTTNGIDAEYAYEIMVHDAVGSLISSAAGTGNFQHISIGEKPGIYFVSLRLNDRIIGIKRVVRK